MRWGPEGATPAQPAAASMPRDAAPARNPRRFGSCCSVADPHLQMGAIFLLEPSMVVSWYGVRRLTSCRDRVRGCHHMSRCRQAASKTKLTACLLYTSDAADERS